MVKSGTPKLDWFGNEIIYPSLAVSAMERMVSSLRIFPFTNRYLNSIFSVKHRIYQKDIIALPLGYF